MEHLRTPPTRLTTRAELSLAEIGERSYSVLVGRNNAGKSYLLKTLVERMGQDAAYIGPARYQNFDHLPFYNPRQDKKTNWWQNFTRWRRQNHTQDQSPVNLQQAIADFSDLKREQLFAIMRELLGVDFEIALSVPDNEMSQRYVRCGGHNLSFTSSGVRLIASILTALIDDDFSKVVIDEPELGISPEAQGILADFLFDREKREEYFLHLRSIVFATHSTVFLDRQNHRNNYFVCKSGDEIDVRNVQSQTEFNEVHFFLLGNRFETLYLPSAIVIVEGKTDYLFIRRIVDLEFPRSLISVIQANGDNRVAEVVHMAGQMLGDIQRSPYRDRIFPIFDKVHGANLKRKIETKGIPEENITVWSKNGIEHFYPSRITQEIFGVAEDVIISDDLVSANGQSYKKGDLCELVVGKMVAGELYDPEFREKFIDRLKGLGI